MAVSMQRGCLVGGNVLWAALLCLSCRLLLPAGASSLGVAGGAAAQPHRRFEYKYSFKGPHLVQGDGSVPFWVHTGSKYPPRAVTYDPRNPGSDSLQLGAASLAPPPVVLAPSD
ncbi:leucine-rich repeat-containing G-protein coupled receptor 5 [Platysternon megacephalum]|uniref:Leucine-rich repeat-containing G-protein coupled receptor 5 n=1 Tax=Platysternon megacephalum TaxID=55544 RepID=A0A4D9ER89_9SAUR|nr:leucine-rich repeat-containing G-protein coupled receptor 5 [Platysternon megacephalum]